MSAAKGDGGEKRGGRAALWFILILLVVGAGATAYMWWRGETRLEIAELEAAETLTWRTEALVRARGAAMGQAIATLSRGYLEQGRTTLLQESYDELVRVPGILSLTIVNLELRAIVATDRKNLDAIMDSEENVQGAMAQRPTNIRGTSFFPIMGSVQRLGTLRVDYDPEGSGLLPPPPSGDDSGE
jgi:hypothetical protein